MTFELRNQKNNKDVQLVASLSHTLTYQTKEI